MHVKAGFIPHGKENQALHWQKLVVRDDVVETQDTQPILPATEPLLVEIASKLHAIFEPK